MISLLKVALLPNRIEPADICPPGSGLAGQRVRLVGIDAIFLQRFANLLAIKLDGATKEYFVWGLRCGFITFGPGHAETADVVCEVLEAKVKGAIRAGISNVSQLSQSLVEKALLSTGIENERAEKYEILRKRAEEVYRVVAEPRFTESWNVYPFNSGYFMCLEIKGVDAEALRVHLLDAYGIGLIATTSTDVRVAFSCLEIEQIEPLFTKLHRAVQELV